MTLKEQIIWTVLGIDDTDTLQKLLALAEEFRQQEKSTPSPIAPSPTAFLPSFSNIKVVTVEEALSSNYAYPEYPKEEIVGQWPSDEPVEELIQMLRP